MQLHDSMWFYSASVQALLQQQSSLSFLPNLICFSIIRCIDTAVLCDPRMGNVVFSQWGLMMLLHPAPLRDSWIPIIACSLYSCSSLSAGQLQDNSFSQIINFSVHFFCSFFIARKMSELLKKTRLLVGSFFFSYGFGNLNPFKLCQWISKICGNRVQKIWRCPLPESVEFTLLSLSIWFLFILLTREGLVYSLLWSQVFIHYCSLGLTRDPFRAIYSTFCSSQIPDQVTGSRIFHVYYDAIKAIKVVDWLE